MLNANASTANVSSAVSAISPSSVPLPHTRPDGSRRRPSASPARAVLSAVSFMRPSMLSFSIRSQL
jgi:hypothetical protein